MQYAKYIKAHPLPEITAEMTETAAKLKADGKLRQYYNNTHSLYTAEQADGVLAITIYEYINDALNVTFRHIYDGETYATQRVSNNKRLSGTIETYLNVYSYWQEEHCFSLDDTSESVVNSYLKVDAEGLRQLYKIEQGMLAEKNIAKYRRKADRIDARMSCIGEVPQEFTDWVRDWVLDEARYYFYNYKRGKKQDGYCSHCRTEFSADKVKHGNKVTCPSCGSKLTCKSLGKTTKYSMVDTAKATYIEPVIDGGTPALVERVFYIRQEIFGHHDGAEKVNVKITAKENYRAFYAETFEPLLTEGVSEYYIGTYGPLVGSRWVPANYKITYLSSCDSWIYPKNMNEIFRAGPEQLKNIEVSAILPYVKTDFTELVKALKKASGIENLAKQGYYKLLREIYKGLKKYYYSELVSEKLINTKAVSCSEMLKIDKQILRVLGDISADEYMLYKMITAAVPIDVTTFRRYVIAGLANNSRTLGGIFQRYGIGSVKLMNYIDKQKLICHTDANAVVSTYNDYLSMTRDLRLPITDSVLFPKNVQIEHDWLMKIKTDRQYPKQAKKLKERAKILEQLDYDNGTYCIKAFRTPQDFLKESSVLGHCVKTYIDRCAEGKTNIYGIRRSNAPDTPYFTLTLSNRAVVETNLGKSNCHPPKEIKDFVKEWEKKIIAKKRDEFIQAANPAPKKEEHQKVAIGA